MITDLAFRANRIDEDLSIIINVSEDMYTLGVYAEGLGTMYSYSSTDLEECYSRVSKFIDCLTNGNKMDKFIKEVLEEDFEVSANE